MSLVPRPTPTQELDLLQRCAQLVVRSDSLDDLLGPLLRLLNEEFRLLRSGLALLDADRGEVAVRAAHGLTPTEVQAARFPVGEGIIGAVAQDGEPRFVERVPQVDRASDPLHRSQSGERSFVCVPIHGTGGILGTLAGYRPLTSAHALQQDVRVLDVIAALIAPLVAAESRQGVQTAAEVAAWQPANLMGRSKPMRQVYELIAQVAPSPTTVLLTGESGTGKELVASAIHRNSQRSREAFVKVNCAALPESVIESELFGHERGSFTGAVAQRKGRFELADGGTLFLDEIGDLSAATQIKLLRVLQEREFERVGGTRTIQVDVRVIAATSRDLDAMMAEGSFRADLFYRLAVFPIRLPALRERRADITLLADHFIEVCSRAHGRDVRRISTSAIDMLMAYHWPGNVRELENCIERAVLLSRDQVILGHHLPPSLQTATATGVPSEALKDRVQAYERELVLDALKSARGNMAEAARLLQTSERIVGLRVDRFGIDPKRFR